MSLRVAEPLRGAQAKKNGLFDRFVHKCRFIQYLDPFVSSLAKPIFLGAERSNLDSPLVRLRLLRRYAPRKDILTFRPCVRR